MICELNAEDQVEPARFVSLLYNLVVWKWNLEKIMMSDQEWSRNSSNVPLKMRRIGQGGEDGAFWWQFH